MELAADLTRRLDGLESDLPPAAARVLHLQRAAVSSATNVAGDAFSAVTEVATSLLGTARNGVKTVLGQARSGVDATGDSVAATGRVGRDQVRTVAGQATAQAGRITEAASEAVEELADRGIERLEDPATGSGPSYDQWTRAELLARARELGIDGRTRMSKPQLIQALRAG